MVESPDRALLRLIRDTADHERPLELHALTGLLDRIEAEDQFDAEDIILTGVLLGRKDIPDAEGAILAWIVQDPTARKVDVVCLLLGAAWGNTPADLLPSRASLHIVRKIFQARSRISLAADPDARHSYRCLLEDLSKFDLDTQTVAEVQRAIASEWK